MSETERRKSALVVGASRGLGLGLSLELCRRGWHVTATVRGAAGRTGLEAYHDQVTLDTLDINNLASVEPFVERMRGKDFDVVFINAGISGAEQKTAETVTPEEITHLTMTNAISPVRLAMKLVAEVKPGTGILAFMTSALGSVELNAGGYASLYCASKAMLNRLSRSFVTELEDDKITVLNVHPGWVRTDMGGPNAEIDVETSARGISDLLEAQAGAGGHRFMDYRGKTIPW